MTHDEAVNSPIYKGIQENGLPQISEEAREANRQRGIAAMRKGFADAGREIPSGDEALMHFLFVADAETHAMARRFIEGYRR